MRGGALARVWGAVVVAGLARAGSFVVLALVAASSVKWGNLAEQAVLLVFATAWASPPTPRADSRDSGPARPPARPVNEWYNEVETR